MTFIIFFVLFFWLLYLHGKTKELSSRITHLESGVHKTEEVVSSSATLKESLQPQGKAPSLEENQQNANISPPRQENAFVAWIKEDWLMKLGGLLLILGVAWFVSYAFAENWIGPLGRIGLGLSGSAGVLLLGRIRMQKYVSQGGVLMFIGALGVVLTVWAGRELYNYFTPTSALAVMFLTTCVLGVTSIRFSRLPLAYANVLLAGVAPMLVASPEPSFTGLFTYLLVLTLGAIWVASITGWRQLVLLSLAIVILYSVPFLGSAMMGYEENGLIFSFVFSGLFFLVSVLGMRHVGAMKVYDLLTATLTGLFLLVWILADAGEEWQSMLLVAWTIVFAFGAFMASRNGATIHYFFTYFGVGVVFLGVATALVLDGPPALTVAFILESALLIVIGYSITRNARYLVLLAVPSVVPILLSLNSVSSWAWRDGLLDTDAIVLYLLAGVSFLLALYLEGQRGNASEQERTLLTNGVHVASIVSGVYTTIVVWRVSGVVIPGDAGVMLALFVYTLVALFFYISAMQTKKHWQKIVAGVYFWIVIGRLLLVDVWNMDLPYRVVTFGAIGVSLIVVAWYTRNKAKKL